MNKGEYITTALSKISYKRYECYAISRLWHKLDDLEIEFLFQQYVSLKEGYILADLYLPQFNIIVEIDEKQHFKYLEKDKVRDNDVIEAIQAKIIRIPVYDDSLSHFDILRFNESIDEIVALIKNKKKMCKETFVPWDLEKKYDTDFYIERGFISLEDKCAFKTMVEAANCFGKQYLPKGIRKGGIKHKNGKSIWFPKLYNYAGWSNSISLEENVIVEKATDSIKRIKHVEDILNLPDHSRIVFAKARNSFGQTLYRFKGEFYLDRNESSVENGLVWRIIENGGNRVETYKRIINN
jgi:very-short-patch-repair endonuclease